ncbi:MAG: hypothetical protein KH050_10365 [Clostridiaceae bacterium]|uniref:hypothetical protein n=1 Tax=Massiliimalia timonensis TaxID=1987501 RepID=UPI000B8A71A3|nr:hypothetical protein [Massiliimalia timonensis]MBS7174654.1 hypothetical protein [Clostridiales bacterium]MBS7225719.1 hypothetical protein [Clostridiaceae bacterium]
MILPQLSEASAGKSTMVDFKGYNHKLFIADGEFYEMQNMTADYYPVLSPRAPRGTKLHLEKPNGIFAKEKLIWVDGNKFYFGGEYQFDVEDSKKSFVSMGAYVIILPDKLYYNTADGTHGTLENRFEATGEVRVSQVKAESGIGADSTYIKIEAEGIGAGFSQYDGVEISGCTQEDLNKTAILQEVEENALTIVGIVAEDFTQTGGLIVHRKLPPMDFVTESENRLWACSSEKHEIYASKLGDPKNWYCYEGISTDSYAVTVGSDGDFTGACTYLGNILFFKEDTVHKIYGSQPSNFQVMSSSIRGVAKGSEKSLAIVNETLYYQSRNGIVAYAGSAPTKISEALGEEAYHSVHAGAIGNKYYASMCRGENEWHLFVWDEGKGMWHREDNTHALGFAALSGELYYLDADTSCLKTVVGNDPEEVFWLAQFGEWNDSSFDKKYISKIQVNAQLSEHATLEIALKTDSAPLWETVYRVTSSEKRTYTIPILPRRCERFQCRLSGKGMCKIFSIAKTVEFGSER